MHGLLAGLLLFLAIPGISSLSMRQVSEIAVMLSLSLTSFLLLLMAIFLGATTIGRDIERKYLIPILSLPLSRSDYFLGRFCGIAFFLVMTSLFCVLSAYICMSAASATYKPIRPIAVDYMLLAVLFDLLKYLLVAACAFLFSAVSTSQFLPFFGTVCLYLIGTGSQEAFDYIHTSTTGQQLSPFFKSLISALYYCVPNLSSFDLKVHAIYGVPIDSHGLLLTAGYWVLMMAITLSAGSLLFSRREIV